MPGPIRNLEDAIAAIAQLEGRLRTAEVQAARAFAFTQGLSGQPAPPVATISVPHNDTYANQDNVDSTHALNLDYVIPSNAQRLVSARLSIKLRAYRTYNSFSASTTGAGSSHAHSHNHGSHSHSHSHGGGSHGHSLHTIAGSGGNALQTDGTNILNNAGATLDLSQVNANTLTTNSDATSTTPGTDATGEASHTHSISGSSFLGVTEGAVASGVAISFDGVDQTAALAGPFNADVVELDVLQFIANVPGGGWHTISLLPSGLGRIQAYLRLGAYVNGTVR
jgi:hypothetical protein